MSDFIEDGGSKAISETSSESTPVRCSKDDQFKIKMCTCPTCMGERSKRNEDGIEVNDSHCKGWVTFRAIAFTCPKCGQESVLVANNMGEYCLNSSCRTKVNIRSAALTAYINSVS